MAVISCLFAMKRDALWLMNSLSKWNSWGLRKNRRFKTLPCEVARRYQK